MTTLKTLFHKPVNRPIEGVIKADDDASLRLEIEEYVLTNEVEKRLEAFLEAYNNYEGANGVWVSGFFGSGKSHLLKMLAMVLENRQIDGESALNLFLSKCGDNEILRGELKRAVTIPSKSILFNIDQKADVISKTQMDALLAVFVKVFDEMCGYYGKQGHIAQFERDLDSRDIYAPFQSAYESIAKRSWIRGREQALLESKNIAKAYSQVTGEDESTALGILEKYRADYKVSIEDFAEKINAYIEKQAPQFRLNFFVDEVGQYIADNVKLMTNLQTLAESLATKCRGRAWIMVTAQEDMSTVVGEMDKQQGNDFSKIQARFANRMKLTSADVAEVIQKRLLLKNEQGVQSLSEIYHREVNNFKTLFDFADGAQTYRNFQDCEHFIDAYPFIPYQFALFQAAIQNLSQHNAFEGKHSSVGERSMLGVFQQVAIQICEHSVGQLATFDLMFEGIRTALKSNIQRAILQAEKHLESPFALRLLKTLFLVKYVKEFKATPRNLSVLMLDSFQQNVTDLRKHIETALGLLEQQTYIQRNGDLYEFLTDEEKDVEQEIKNTDVDAGDVAEQLKKWVFDLTLRPKIRAEKGNQDYPYSKKLDDRLHGREYELSIHVISPFHDLNREEGLIQLQMQNMGRDELLVLMPADDRLIRDLLMYKRTEKYVNQNLSLTQKESVQRILMDKRFQSNERENDLKEWVKSLMGKSRLFVAGTEVEVNANDPQARINQGFYALLSRTYPHLGMLHGKQYTEDDIAHCLRSSEDSLAGTDVIALTEAEQEVFAFIQSNQRSGLRSTLKSLTERFERKPYGWSYAAVLCTLAYLCARGKVEVRSDGNLLEGLDLERALRNSNIHGNLILEPQAEFTAAQTRALKEFFEDFFDAPPKANEAKALAQETAEAFSMYLQKLKGLWAQSNQYPFLNALETVQEQVAAHTGKPYAWYLSDLPTHADVLLDVKEQCLDPIVRFMKGPQKEVFRSAYLFAQHQAANFAYVAQADALELQSLLQSQQIFRGQQLQRLMALHTDLQIQIQTQLQAEIVQAERLIETLQARLCEMPDFTALEPQQQAEITDQFVKVRASIAGFESIPSIRDLPRRFEDSEYPQLLQKLVRWAQAASKSPVDEGPSEPEAPKIEYVPSRAIQVKFEKAWLADEADVDSYLTSMRKALVAEIKQGKRIQI